MSAALRLGVVVPCRDEGRVIARRLANLALARWPEGAAHRVVVVDDGSRDGTAGAARACAERFAGGPAGLEVVRNAGPPGKAGAVATGIARLADEVDVVVLTDADVLARPDALVALARAFAAEPELVMACGAQELVRDLCEDGTCRGADGGEPVPAAGIYDRVTARVRALESRSGRTFSVHGQLLAWRAGLGLAPTPGIAADDLDLMLQARARGGRVRLVQDARFLERKTPPGAARDGQALRRARAYFQVLGSARGRCAARGAADRVQLALYRLLPGLFPWLVLAAAAAGLAAAGALAGTLGLALAAAALALAACTSLGRRIGWLCDVIARAWWRERREPLADRWEMERS